jgi:hypothetical protein
VKLLLKGNIQGPALPLINTSAFTSSLFGIAAAALLCASMRCGHLNCCRWRCCCFSGGQGAAGAADRQHFHSC